MSGGGSRFTVLPGGQVNVQAGYALSLQGSLLVNNGTINGATTINYGATAKGTGVFGPVTVLDGGKFSPGNSPGTATLNGAYTLGAGGSMDLEIFDALGTAGATTGWDLVRLLGANGLLDVQAGSTSNSRFVIHLASGDISGPQPALHFDNHSIYDWLIVDTAQGITGLDPGDIGIDASSFLNPLDGGTFSVAERSGDLYLHYQPVPEPIDPRALRQRPQPARIHAPPLFLRDCVKVDPAWKAKAHKGGACFQPPTHPTRAAPFSPPCGWKHAPPLRALAFPRWTDFFHSL